MGIAERRQREKDKRRKEIVLAAEKVFFAKGFENTTIDDIASAAELSKGTIYLYFEGKEDLHDAVVFRGVKLLSGMFREAVDREDTGLGKVRAIGEAYARFFREHEDYFNALLRFQTHKQEVLGSDDPMMLVIDALRTGIDDGSIRQDIDPVKMAILLWGETTGVMQNNHLKCKAITEAFEIDCDEITEYFMEQTFRLLAAELPAADEGVSREDH
jgi:AcrR family transcriptional regulator